MLGLLNLLDVAFQFVLAVAGHIELGLVRLTSLPLDVDTAVDVTDTAELTFIVRKLDAMDSVDLYVSTQVVSNRMAGELEDAIKADVVVQVDAIDIMHWVIKYDFEFHYFQEFQVKKFGMMMQFDVELLQVPVPHKLPLNYPSNKPKSEDSNPNNFVLQTTDLQNQKLVINSLLGVQHIVVVEHKDELSKLEETTAVRDVDTTMKGIMVEMGHAIVRLVTVVHEGLEDENTQDLVDPRNFRISFNSFLKIKLQFEHFQRFYSKS